jgi:hypothetical protein
MKIVLYVVLICRMAIIIFYVLFSLKYYFYPFFHMIISHFRSDFSLSEPITDSLYTTAKGLQADTIYNVQIQA